MASVYCGQAFEDLSDAEMRNINGGGLELTITTWSSIPCSISATISGTIITLIYLATN